MCNCSETTQQKVTTQHFIKFLLHSIATICKLSVYVTLKHPPESLYWIYIYTSVNNTTIVSMSYYTDAVTLWK